MGDIQLGPNVTVTDQQLATLLQNAGFTGEDVTNFIKIAHHEDPALNVGVVNDTPGTGDYSVGLWQINYFDTLNAPRTAEFGSAQSLAGDAQAQANAAHTLFQQSGYSPWQADINAGVLSGPIPVTAKGGSGAPAGPGTSSQYQAASNAFGKFLQALDGFYNPSVSVAPSWLNLFGVGTTINSGVQAVLTVVDRGLGVLFGAGLIYLGIRFMGSGDGGGSSLLKTGAEVYGINRVSGVRELEAGARTATAQARVQSSQITAGARQAATEASAERSRVASQQRAADREYRIASDAVKNENRRKKEAKQQADADRKYKLSVKKLDLQQQAEDRRQAETFRPGRRVTERKERG